MDIKKLMQKFPFYDIRNFMKTDGFLSTYTISILLGILFILLNIGIYILGRNPGFLGRFKKQPPQPIVLIPTPTPTPRPIAHGKQTYAVSTKDSKGPSIHEVIFDPIDAKIGETQSFSVSVTGTTPVASVMVSFRTDKNVFTNHTLTRISGTPLDGTWNKSFPVENIRDYLYQATITATDANTSSSTTVTIL